MLTAATNQLLRDSGQPSNDGGEIIRAPPKSEKEQPSLTRLLLLLSSTNALVGVQIMIWCDLVTARGTRRGTVTSICGVAGMAMRGI